MQLSLFVLRLTVVDEVPDFTSPKCNNNLVCAVFNMLHILECTEHCVMTHACSIVLTGTPAGGGGWPAQVLELRTRTVFTLPLLLFV